MNLDEIEARGALALAGSITWAALERELGVPRRSLQTHMQNHYVAPASEVEQALEGLDAAVAENIEELLAQMRIAPAELKPFYAVAIQNLQALSETKASQQNLINALKAIHEVTGMKMEQRLMLQFGQAAFGLTAERPAGELVADTGVIDAVVVSEEAFDGAPAGVPAAAIAAQRDRCVDAGR